MLLSTLPFETDPPSELLLDGERVVALGHSYYGIRGGGGPEIGMVASDMAYPGTSGSTVRVIDIKDPAKPAVVATMKLEGNYVSARMAGGVVRLVVSSSPKGPIPPMRSFRHCRRRG